MSKTQKPISFNRESEVFNDLRKLKKIYNIKTLPKLVEHIVKLEIKRHWLEKELD